MCSVSQKYGDLQLKQLQVNSKLYSSDELHCVLDGNEENPTSCCAQAKYTVRNAVLSLGPRKMDYNTMFTLMVHGANPSETGNCEVSLTAIATSLDSIIRVSGFNESATVDDVTNTCGTVSMYGPGVWYEVRGTTGAVLVASSTCDSSAGTLTPDTQLSVFSGTCDQLKRVAGNNNSFGGGT
jgi:hypothetical protein